MATEKDILWFAKILKGFKIQKVLGKSALGTLYKIEHSVYGISVLKYFEGQVLENPKLLKKLLSESKTAQEIEHPYIAHIYQMDYQPHPFVIREWVEGISLQEKYKEKAMPALDATELLIKIVLGIQAAYNFSIRHKNIKPTNIILTPQDSLKIVDFLLPPSVPYYISPEQILAKKSDIRSDIYSMGILYYKVLTGRVPFAGKMKETSKKHLEEKYPQIPDLPEEIKDVLDHCLAKKVEDRYSDPMELLISLRKARQRLVEDAMLKNPVTKESVTFSLPKIEELMNILSPMSQTGMSLINTTSMLVAQKRQETLDITQEIIPEEMTEELPSSTEENLHEGQEESLSENRETEQPKKIASAFLPTEEEDFWDIEILEEKTAIEPAYENLPRNLPEYLERALLLATDVKALRQNGKILTSLTIPCSKEYKEKILEYLRLVLRRECWVVQEEEQEEKIHIVIDLELAKTFRYFNHFEDRIQNALAKLPKLSTIHKSIITRIQPMDEVKVVDEESKPEKNPSKDSKDSKDASIYNVLDTIIGISENELQAVSEENPEDTEERIDRDEEILYEETLDLMINFQNPCQTRAWFKLVKEHGWEQGKHFELQSKKKHGLKNLCFTINLLELQEYERKRTGVSSVKEFFQGDYEITRFDHGGMAAVLKLTTKDDTIIFLRPENHWARQKFAPYLCVRQGLDGKECVYAQMPKGTEFVVKVAFEGREEALIYESRLLSNLAQDANISKNIIGMVQQGSFLASPEESTAEKQEERIGYYMMMEYASWGNIDQFSRKFPDYHLPPNIALLVLYGMVLTLQHLKKKGIIHRDIKPQNILMDPEGVPKLSDFGLAITVEEAGAQLNEERRRLLRLVDKEFLTISNKKEQLQTRVKKNREKIKQLAWDKEQDKFEEMSVKINEMYREIDDLVEQEKARAEGLKERYRPMSAEEIALKGEFAGSLYYAAPEQFAPAKVLTCQCDVYQLGAVSYTMLTGKFPVKGKNIAEVMSQIVLGHKKPHITETLKKTPLVNLIDDLVYQMMEQDPEQRITIEETREKLENILVHFSNEIIQEPCFTLPARLKTEKEIKSWNEKVEYAKKVYQKMLPGLEKLIQEIKAKKQKEKEEKEAEERARNIKSNSMEIIPLWREKGKESSLFRFHCPSCNRKLQLPPSKVGKSIQCPNCKQKLMAKYLDE
ncbi:MAG: protein kinase [Candidatus Brocadiae bacterium]|nr:protein kinase [Candidatus Brocadiia bacterium]